MCTYIYMEREKQNSFFIRIIPYSSTFWSPGHFKHYPTRIMGLLRSI